jgi:hypothetical protein
MNIPITVFKVSDPVADPYLVKIGDHVWSMSYYACRPNEVCMYLGPADAVRLPNEPLIWNEWPEQVCKMAGAIRLDMLIQTQTEN